MPAEPNAVDLAALGARVRSERLHLRLSIDDAAERAGMSPVTWGRVEKGLPVRSLSYAGIESVVGWARGSIDRYLLDRTEPTDDGDATPEHPDIPMLDPDIEEVLRRMADPRTSEANREYMRQQLRLLASLPELDTAERDTDDREHRRAAG